MKVSVTYQFDSEEDAAKFMAGKGGKPAASGAADKPAASGKPNKPKHTKAEVTAALNEVKDKFDAATAKGIIKEVGKADKLAEIAEANYDAVYDAAKAKVEEGGDEGGGDDDM